MAGIRMTHVPYKGAAPQLADVAGKHITMTMSSIGATLPFIESGKVKALGVTSAARVPSLPNVPAIAEYAPLAGYEFINFFGFYAPADTPQAIVRRLNAAAVQAIRNPGQAAKLHAMGFQPAPGTPEEFRTFLRSQSTLFGRIIAEADVRIEQ
jgi:tripartite-type tricarboxylate transporter receptor subunit TctC